MTTTVLDQLIGVSREELALLRQLNEMGAASADELAVRLNRAGEDIMPHIENLVKHRLLQVRSLDIAGDTIELYMTDRNIRELL